jgi:hypothetical protein
MLQLQRRFFAIKIPKATWSLTELHLETHGDEQPNGPFQQNSNDYNLLTPLVLSRLSKRALLSLDEKNSTTAENNNNKNKNLASLNAMIQMMHQVTSLNDDDDNNNHLCTSTTADITTPTDASVYDTHRGSAIKAPLRADPSLEQQHEPAIENTTASQQVVTNLLKDHPHTMRVGAHLYFAVATKSPK